MKTKKVLDAAELAKVTAGVKLHSHAQAVIQLDTEQQASHTRHIHQLAALLG